MPNAYYLSEEDRDDLRALFSEWASERLNPANRAPAQTDDYPTTGAYVALFTDGIPALSMPSGTGSSLEAAPGSAQATVYRLLDFTGTPRIYPLGINDVTVYNVSETDVPPGKWALVVQDKFNNWYITGVGGSVAPGTGSAEAEIVLVTTEIQFNTTGTGSTDLTYIYEGYIINVAAGTFVVGQITELEHIYILQRTSNQPETERILRVGGVYTAVESGDGYHNLKNEELDPSAYRRVFIVTGVPLPPTRTQRVVTGITGLEITCNPNHTITGVVTYTTEDIPVIDPS